MLENVEDVTNFCIRTVLSFPRFDVKLHIMTGKLICTGGCGCDTHRNTLTQNLLAAGRCFLEVTEFMKMAFVARNFHYARERVTDHAIVKQYV
jgi:hypothetical protein